MPDPSVFNIHLISDSTGETLHAMIRAALAPFGDVKVELEISIFVRNEAELETALEKARACPGFILFTLADQALRKRLYRFAEEEGMPALAALGGLIEGLAAFLHQKPSQKPGLQYRLNDNYFSRIAALDFAIAHDDGALGTRLMRADVILTGVSRTSKTPTCIYLAHRGIKAANVPLVPGRDPPEAFFDAMAAGIPIMGLTASPARLSQIRSQRLEVLGDYSNEYAEIDQIRKEIADARLFFDRHEIPVIDVTRRSIEETAAEIQAALRARKNPT